MSAEDQTEPTIENAEPPTLNVEVADPAIRLSITR